MAMTPKRPFTLSLVVACLGFIATPAAVAQLPSAARWIAPAAMDSPGVYDFRKVVEIPSKPAHQIVYVSADNRFRLYVNGQWVGEGPARGDLQHWRYESFDVAPLLHAGRNVLAARVWNFGAQSPSAQISLRTGFLLWTSPTASPSIDTDASWQVRAEPAWRYEATGPPLNSIVGPGEVLDGHTYDWNWEQADDPSASWSPAAVLAPPTLATSLGPAHATPSWTLTPDTLPAMQSTLESAGSIVRSDRPTPASPSFPLTLAPHSHASFLLDHGVLTTAYPQLTVTGGADAQLRMTYAEALYDDHGEKGNRNDIANKHMDMHLLHDLFLPSGESVPQTFEPLWWRTWRFLQVDITTGSQSVTVHALRARYTAYPFQQRAAFQSSDPELSKIWEVGWRTARLDAHETYMDCPYYEQTQYVGDTRIQALISYAMSGDDRLARQALLAFADSALPSGLTQSSFPVHGVQVIPPFSLLWIGMLHDFWMYRPNTESTITEMLPQVRLVLNHFRGLERQDGLLGKLPQNGFGYWNFIDWTAPYLIGAPPEDKDGGSIPLSLQFAEALQQAADLEAAFGDRTNAAQDRQTASKIDDSVNAEAWDDRVGLLADTPSKTSFSQHANILGVLTGAIPAERSRAVLQKILSRELTGAQQADLLKLAPASYYFRFYLARALDAAGLDDLYLQTLGPWRNMLALGLTTWAEQPEPTRSDAHAWSAHPNFDLLTLVAGIRPDAPAFASVLIAPHLGSLTSLDATMPHPLGNIHVRYRRQGHDLAVTINMPASLHGHFVYAGNQRDLHGGSQSFTLADSSVALLSSPQSDVKR